MFSIKSVCRTFLISRDHQPRHLTGTGVGPIILTSVFSQGFFRNASSEVREEKPLAEAHPHSDLYTRNLTLINITNFKFLINNDICNVSPVAIVTIVHSAVENKAARDIIRCVVKIFSSKVRTLNNLSTRTSWGSPNISDAVMKLVFLLGEEKIIYFSLPFLLY